MMLMQGAKCRIYSDDVDGLLDHALSICLAAGDSGHVVRDDAA